MIDDETSPQRKKVGLALAGGVLEGGFYDIGVLCALQDAVEGLDFTALDVYVGVSSGAVTTRIRAWSETLFSGTSSDTLVALRTPRLLLHNCAGPICHAACLHLGAHLPNLAFVESVRAFYRTYFEELTDYKPVLKDGRFLLPSGPGLGVRLREDVLSRPDLTRQISEGKGAAVGRRAMGDHWEREEIR